MKQPTILIVDDDESIRFAFQKTFEEKPVKTQTLKNGTSALKWIQQTEPSLVFMDIMMPDVDGLDVLKQIKQMKPEIPVVIITGFGSMHTAMKAIKLGAYEYLTKPLDVDKIRYIADRALEMVRLRKELTEFKQRVTFADDGYELIGQSEKMQEVYKKMGAAAATPNTTNILIQGESGTGKELVARAIHQNGEYPNELFIAINCTALSENLFESELFGYEKGAFTGAYGQKIGKLEQARSGTLFLDEIGGLSTHLQQKLLRVLQEREFTRVGGNKMIPVKARFIAATNHNLKLEVKENRFREDLYYRLNVMLIEIPPLRERLEDIPLLATFFLDRYKKRIKKTIKVISSEAMDILIHYDFPGNVRELENMIERAVILEKGEILSSSTFKSYIEAREIQEKTYPDIFELSYSEARKKWIHEFENKFIIEQLKKNNGNVTTAAEMAGLKRQSFQRLMKKHHIYSKNFRKKK